MNANPIFGSLFFVLVLSACATPQPMTTDSPLYKYRADMQITIDGGTFYGFGVTNMTDEPKQIEIVSNAALDLLRITTCHRDFTIENADPSWFGGSGHTYTYTYTPTKEEKTSVCPMYIQAFARNEVTDWGYLVFRTDEKLPAHMDCNGGQWDFSGISVCQTQAGLNEMIRFDVPVKFQTDNACVVIQNSPQEYVVHGPPGFCYVEFSPDGKAWHRLIMLGYEKVLAR